MESSEYQRLHELETRHFWYRGLHALVLGTLRAELAAGSASGSDVALPAAPVRGAPAPGPTHADSRRSPAARRLLDAGCGTGGLTVQLDEFGRVTALDWSPHALEFAARRGVQRLLRGSVAAVPLASRSFDAVVSCDVLYHRAVPDDAAALNELARVCRPGGLLLLNLPAHTWMRGSHDRQVHTARRYDRAAVRRLAAAAGLDVVRLSWWNCALFPAAMLVRLATRGGETARSDVSLPPAAVNAPLSAWMRLEARAARHALLPWGLSLFAVLRRPPDAFIAGPRARR